MNTIGFFRRFQAQALVLWGDEGGEASTLSLILICTIIAIGALVGLTTLRDQLVQEFGDLGMAIESLDQSFSAGPYGSYADPAPPASTGIGFN
jgi:hypothetical protein